MLNKTLYVKPGLPHILNVKHIKATEMKEIACNWTPQLIVEVIKSVIWPLSILLIALILLLITLIFRSGIIKSIRSFFSKNSIAELSASPSGFSAKFVTAKQSLETLESGNSSSVALPENMAIEAIKERHVQATTEFSIELFNSIKTHIKALNIPPEEAQEILIKELSLLQSALRYLDINKVLFRSQFNLFYIMSNHYCPVKNQIIPIVYIN